MRLFRKKIEDMEPSPWQERLGRYAGIGDFILDLIIIFLVVSLFRIFFFAPFRVQQESMLPNILDGEYILVSKLPYNDWVGWKDYKRYDIIVVRPSIQKNAENNYLIKRLIGLPGETLKSREGSLWVRPVGQEEFEKVEDSFLAENNRGTTCLWSRSCTGLEKSEEMLLTIPEGSYFVLGDNRTRSSDSRNCFGEMGCSEDGNRFLSKNEVEGRAIFVFARQHKVADWWRLWDRFSFDVIRKISNPVFDAPAS